jgi:hypothetical protein
MTELEIPSIRAQETRKHETHLVGPKPSDDLSQSEWMAFVDSYRYPSLRDNKRFQSVFTLVLPAGCARQARRG